MRKAFVSVILLLMCRLVSLSAQEGSIVNIDWNAFLQDTVVPRFSFQIEPESDYESFSYSCEIEYPELIPLTKEQINRLHIAECNPSVSDWPVIDSYLGVSAKKASLDVSFIPVVLRDGKYYGIHSFRPLITKKRNSSMVAGIQSSAVPARERYTSRSMFAEGKWVKIRVSQTGIFKISDASLRKMGFSKPDNVRLFGYGGAKLSEYSIQNLTDDVIQQPIWRGSGYMLFYAKGPISWNTDYNNYPYHSINPYSEVGYYFLTESDTINPLYVTQEETGTIDGVTMDTYSDYALYEKDEFSWYHSGSRFFESYDYQNRNTKQYQFPLEGITDDAVKLTLAFAADGSKSSTVSIKVNGKDAGSLYIPPVSGDESASVAEMSIMCNGMFSANGIVELTHNGNAGISGRLDFIRLAYMRKLALRGSFTAFRTRENGKYINFKISDSKSTVEVWRIGSSGKISSVPSSFVGDTTVTVSSWCKSSDEFVAVDVNGSFSEPEIVGMVENQNLHGLDSIDMVIIVPSSGKLTAQANRLADAHRKTDSLRVAVVRADQVYNEFSSGTPDATAFRRLMKMLYDRADENSLPRYLLLFGDGAWDNRMVTSEWIGVNPDDYLLCYESYNSTSHTNSFVMEDYYGLLDDSEGNNLLYDKVDIGVGRLPITTESEAKIMVDKIIAYMNGENSGSWRNKIAILGDDGDNNTHMSDADDVARMIAEKYPSLLQKKIYWDSYKMEVSAAGNSYPEVRKQILELLDEGALLVDYVGHGSAEVFSHELVINKTDLSSFKSKHLPFWITASCDITPFDASISNLGESLMLNADGGAIGLLTTTRSVYANLNRYINMLFSEYALGKDENGKRNAVGDALRMAKTGLVTTGSSYYDNTTNKLHFVLIGDPALKLAVPDYSVVVDSFGGKQSNSDSLQAKAGSIITVKGHIEDNGIEVSDFNGLIYPTLFDNERTITTFNNTGQADAPFSYSDRDRLLYSGTDSVRNGKFSFSVPIPMDINYSDKNGKIYLYAEQSDTRRANGYFDNFLVGGTVDGLRNDSLGPEISMYLNKPDFQYGGKVNNIPLFVADLFDKDGLNTSGNGLGHDLTLIIDNNPDYTYSLNSYFRFAQGDFSRGRVIFSIPSLPDGVHTLMFRAWDVFNNSTTRYLKFKVDSELKPELSVQMTENPARISTTFVVNHDRPAGDATVTIQVIDYNGKVHWSGVTKETSPSGVSYIDWNLTGSNGVKLQRGIYMIKAIVSTSTSSRSDSEKLIVL